MDTSHPSSYHPGMPVCARCGEENPERARFCLACAAPLSGPAAPRREERKRVSVLFCDLVGFTSRSERLDVEDVRSVLAPYYARLRADLERFGGTVEKFIGDAVMALFGAPVAHEDDPERAVRAALAIRDTIADLNQATPGLGLQVRVGVTTGEALVVLDARPVEGEGMAAGDVVNTAARLQTAAPVDGILVDETTWRATDRQIRYQEAAPVPAKGKADPVPAWLALAPRANLGIEVDQGSRAALVGREREVALLRAALVRARDEQSVQLVTLVGVPGIGKSRLVWELLQTVEAEPELTVWRQGRCLPYGEGVAVWALGEMVKAQAGILDTDPAEVAEAKLTQAVGELVADQPEADWLSGRLRPLVGLAGLGTGAADRQEEAFAAWRRFCEALAEQGPAVLVFGDLHWADELLLDFLDHLVDWAAEVPLLVVATARPELLARRPSWGGGKLNSATVSLAPLGDDDTARLVAGLLDQALLPAETQAALLARAGGNPLFAEEYVRMLADRGFLRRVGSSWRLEDAEELPLPESVQGIIAARLDALGEQEKALVQDAAVLGKVGWLGALAALGGEQPFLLEQRLHALERKEFLRRERRSAVAGERQYAFRHVLVRDVAYQQLPRPVRAGKHRKAAEWLQGLSPDRAEDQAELLAHHWQAALTYARAAGQDVADLAGAARLAFREAGDRSLALPAVAAAAGWYQAALELWPVADPDRPRLLYRLGRARAAGEQTGEELLAEARDGLLAQGDREAAAEAEALLGQLLWRQGRGEEAMVHDRRASELLADAGPSPAKAFVLVHLAGGLGSAGQNQEAIRVGREALAILSQLGLEELRARALNYVGLARVTEGDSGGLADLEQAVAITARRNSPDAVMAYGNLAAAHVTLGGLARAFELQGRAREVAERLGLAGDLRHFEVIRVMEHYWRGSWDAAVDGADRFIAESEAGARHVSEAECRLARCAVRLARGELAGALADADAARELARAANLPDAAVGAQALAARVLIASGRREQAGGLLATVDQGHWAITPWSGELAVALEVLGRGAALVELAAGIEHPNPWARAATAVAAGELELAADRYAEIGSRPDEAFARLRAAERLLAAGRRSEANLQLERSMAFYREVRAEGFLRRASRLQVASA